MRTLILALIPGLLLACGNDMTATAAADETGGESTGTSTTGSPTGDPSNPSDPSDPSNPSGDATTDPTTGNGTDPTVTTAATVTSEVTTTTTDPTGATDTTDPGTTDSSTTNTTDSTTGDLGLCGDEGTVIDATLVRVGEDPGCGPLEFNGSNYVLAPGPIYTLDGCPCGANCIVPDPWTFSLDVPPLWLPTELPACPRIVVERQMSKAGCELVGVAIWDTQEPEGAPATYLAASLLGPAEAAQGQITVASVPVEECECADCCSVPTRFDLGFEALKSEVTLPEGQTGMLGDADLGYEVINFQSHVSGICDDSPAIDWIARRVGAP